MCFSVEYVFVQGHRLTRNAFNAVRAYVQQELVNNIYFYIIVI